MVSLTKRIYIECAQCVISRFMGYISETEGLYDKLQIRSLSICMLTSVVYFRFDSNNALSLKNLKNFLFFTHLAVRLALVKRMQFIFYMKQQLQMSINN